MSTKYQTNEDVINVIKNPEATYISPESGTGFRTDVIFSCESKSGMKLYVTSQKSIILGIPHDDMSIYEFLFDTKEDWENFCEATWETEHYVGIRKEHFIEMFEALMFVESYHKNRLSQARLKFDAVAQEIKEQEHGLRQLRNIVERYEEVYSENKVQ